LIFGQDNISFDPSTLSLRGREAAVAIHLLYAMQRPVLDCFVAEPAPASEPGLLA
jgi:hypothetical protein